jgi:hypothetical protein
MACTDGLCSIRPLNFASQGIVMLGTPLSIVLNPIDFDTWFSQPYTECVVSFCAVQKSNNSLVVVTIGDLLAPDITYTQDKENPLNVTDPYFSFSDIKYPYPFINGPRSAQRSGVVTVGDFSNYNPLYKTPDSGPIVYNQVNAGIIYPYGYYTGGSILPIASTPLVSSTYTSWQNSYTYFNDFSGSFTEPSTFASTAEIDAITTDTEIKILGYEQAKQGECGVRINSVNATHTFSLDGISGTFPFNHLLSFTRINPECGNPVIAKDKGAPIFAYIASKWKIIGIVIGFDGATGYGSRIDYIADQLNIEAWDGTVKQFTNFSMAEFSSNSQEITSRVSFVTKPGLNYTKSFTQNGILYKQIGTSNLTL